MEKQYVILYTHQKQKKAKTWHDGTLKHSGQGTRLACTVEKAAKKSLAVLYDEKGGRLDSLHIRVDDIMLGEQLESDRYLILVEELKPSTQGPVGHQSGTEPQTQAPTSKDVNNSIISNSQPSQPLMSKARCAGLKRKKTGFMPPRMVKQANLNTQDHIPLDQSISMSSGQSTPAFGQHSVHPTFQQFQSRDLNQRSPDLDQRLHDLDQRFYGNAPPDSQSSSLLVDPNRPVSSGRTYKNLLGMYTSSNRSGSESSSQESQAQVPSLSPWSVYGSAKSSPSLPISCFQKDSNTDRFGKEASGDKKKALFNIDMQMAVNNLEQAESPLENQTEHRSSNNDDHVYKNSFYKEDDKTGNYSCVKTTVQDRNETLPSAAVNVPSVMADAPQPKRKLAQIMSLIRKKPLPEHAQNDHLPTQSETSVSRCTENGFSDGTVSKSESFQSVPVMPEKVKGYRSESVVTMNALSKKSIQASKVSDCESQHSESDRFSHVQATKAVDCKMMAVSERGANEEDVDRGEQFVLSIEEAHNKLECDDDSMMNYDIVDSQLIAAGTDSLQGDEDQASANIASDNKPEHQPVSNGIEDINEQLCNENAVAYHSKALPEASDDQTAAVTVDSNRECHRPESEIDDAETEDGDMFVGSFAISFSPLSEEGEDSDALVSEDGPENKQHITEAALGISNSECSIVEVNKNVQGSFEGELTKEVVGGMVEDSQDSQIVDGKHTADNPGKYNVHIAEDNGDSELNADVFQVSHINADFGKDTYDRTDDEVDEQFRTSVINEDAKQEKNATYSEIFENPQNDQFKIDEKPSDDSPSLVNLEGENSEVQKLSCYSVSGFSECKTTESQDTMELSLDTVKDDSEQFYVGQTNLDLDKYASSVSGYIDRCDRVSDGARFDFRNKPQSATESQFLGLIKKPLPWIQSDIEASPDVRQTDLSNETKQFLDSSKKEDNDVNNDLSHEMSSGSGWFEDMQDEFENKRPANALHRQQIETSCSKLVMTSIMGACEGTNFQDSEGSIAGTAPDCPDMLDSAEECLQLSMPVSPLSNLPHPSKLFRKSRKQEQQPNIAERQSSKYESVKAGDRHLFDDGHDAGKLPPGGVSGSYWMNRTSSCIVSRHPLSVSSNINSTQQNDMTDNSMEVQDAYWRGKRLQEQDQMETWVPMDQTSRHGPGEEASHFFPGKSTFAASSHPSHPLQTVSVPRPDLQDHCDDEEIYNQLYRPRPMYSSRKENSTAQRMYTTSAADALTSEVQGSATSKSQRINLGSLSAAGQSGLQVYKLRQHEALDNRSHCSDIENPEMFSKDFAKDTDECFKDEMTDSMELFHQVDPVLHAEELSEQYTADVSDVEGACVPMEEDLKSLYKAILQSEPVTGFGLQSLAHSKAENGHNLYESQSSEEFFIPATRPPKPVFSTLKMKLDDMGRGNCEQRAQLKNSDCQKTSGNDESDEATETNAASKWGKYIPSDTSDDGLDLSEYVDTSKGINRDFTVIARSAVKIDDASLVPDMTNKTCTDTQWANNNQSIKSSMRYQPCKQSNINGDFDVRSNVMAKRDNDLDDEQLSETNVGSSYHESEVQDKVKDNSHKKDQAVPGSFPSTDSFDELFDNDPFPLEDLACSKEGVHDSQDDVSALLKNEKETVDCANDSETVNNKRVSGTESHDIPTYGSGSRAEAERNRDSNVTKQTIDNFGVHAKEKPEVGESTPSDSVECVEDANFICPTEYRDNTNAPCKGKELKRNNEIVATVVKEKDNGCEDIIDTEKQCFKQTKYSDDEKNSFSQKSTFSKGSQDLLVKGDKDNASSLQKKDIVKEQEVGHSHLTLDDSLDISFIDLEPVAAPADTVITIGVNSSCLPYEKGGMSTVRGNQADSSRDCGKIKPTFSRCLKLLSRIKPDAGKDGNVDLDTESKVLSDHANESLPSKHAFKSPVDVFIPGSQAGVIENFTKKAKIKESFESNSSSEGHGVKHGDMNLNTQQYANQRKAVNRGFQPPAMKGMPAVRPVTPPVCNPRTQSHKVTSPGVIPRKQQSLVTNRSGQCVQAVTSNKSGVTCDRLCFPRKSDVEASPSAVRQVVIPVCIPTAAVYKQVLTQAVVEYVNSQLYEVSRRYHQALNKVDVSGICQSGGMQSTKTSPNPACQCGIPAKMVMVRKEGRNNGRFFYACSANRKEQCKWADEKTKGGSVMSGGTIRRIDDCRTLSLYLKDQRLHFYSQCSLIKRSKEHIRKYFKAPKWVRRNEDEESLQKKQLFLRLPYKGPSSLYAKDDIWVVSSQLTFNPGQMFLARSTFYGPNSANEVEIEPLEGYSPSNWGQEAVCHAILTGNMSAELSYLDNIRDHVNLQTLPLIPHLLHRNDSNFTGQDSRFQATRFQGQGQQVTAQLYISSEHMSEISQRYIEDYSLNRDQAEALRRVAAMFTAEKSQLVDSVLLIHGVFGAGKSFLLSVMVLFLMEVFQMNVSQADNGQPPWKLLISSTTNVAVDRILMGLLDLGFTEFIRVGSVKKIAKPVLPYSVHATGTDSQELKDLQTMLRSDELTVAEKSHVRQSIEKHRLGENKKKLKAVQVVGVTCASCSLPCLNNMTFPLVLLDECSQMTEPSSLLPMARFGCQKLLLVGDPKQLDPTIQGAEAAHDQGLEQTMFDRLIKMGYVPTILRTQYRCHPNISAVANRLFYGGILADGVSESDRKPLLDVLPTLCYYDVDRGQECCEGVGSYYNEREAQFVVFLLGVLLASGLEPETIGVITLYRSQMYLIIDMISGQNSGREMKGVQVSTVDAFQGGERDIIILSCVRTDACGFIDNDKRTNVAVTRARHHLLIVGNLRNMTKNQLWGSVIALCKELPHGVQSADEARHDLEQYLEALKTQETSLQGICPSSGEGATRQGKTTAGGKRGKKKQVTDDVDTLVSCPDGTNQRRKSQGKRGKKRQLSGDKGLAVCLSDDEFASPAPGKENQTIQSKKTKRHKRASKKANELTEVQDEENFNKEEGVSVDNASEADLREQISEGSCSAPMSLTDNSEEMGEMLMDKFEEDMEVMTDEAVKMRPGRAKLSHKLDTALFESDTEQSDNEDFPVFSV